MNEEEKKAVEILNTFELRRKTKNYKEISLEDSQSVETLLNLIEKLQKENKELREQVNMFDEAYSGAIKESKKWFDIAHDSIPKSVIEDKIDVLEKIQKEFKNNEELRIKIITYKELLNKGE